MFAVRKMSNFLWKKYKKYADRPYLIFLAMLVETKNIFTHTNKCNSEHLASSLLRKEWNIHIPIE